MSNDVARQVSDDNESGTVDWLIRVNAPPASYFVGRLPDGQVTSDLVHYGRTWRELGDAVAEKLDANLVGMDPLQLTPKDSAGEMLILPVWAAKKLIAL